MKKIRIIPEWSFTDEAGKRLDPQLFGLLQAIHQSGKLTVAAKGCGISYRHAWNLLNKWTDFFGLALVEMQRGRGARLSPLGEKLLWAEQRVIARLGPQLESLGSELNLEIQQLLEGVKPVLRLHASHGYAVALLPKFATDLQLDLQYCSPREALAALNRGACDLAGFHLPTSATSGPLIQAHRRLLKPRSHRVIRFITRCQGLMVKPDNPKRIKGLPDLLQADVRFINRQKDSGTRALLDGLLREAGLSMRGIRGYELEEYTHSAVAAYIAAGMADVGFGVEAAARQFGLGFIPLASEHYLMVCHGKSLSDPKFQRLFELIESEAFKTAVAELPGYSPDRCGEVCDVDELFAN
ncbi:ModE molybdate transport repressor domain-containing protein [Modicisalibacter muralis]|uniref:ModE molybdate transport repressor domain-containing protein n=1 Tax=Modicisalibacter muralis TaxID=119000 RepID=A0A1G9LF48_9GAMM|nr:substrate-binding domain-containing protein [Halomonas muralis]SDL60403.1 ModE molybdate transport repressor domain-containing protein [Halomonas muralis]